MLDTELSYYLKTHFGKPTVDFKLSDEENDELLAFLYEKSRKGDLQNPQNQLEIKQAFKEYFESVGYVLFKISNGKILLKVFPYRIEPQDSINLPPLLQIFSDNRYLIEYNYQDDSDQILIPSKLKSRLFDFLSHIDNEEINKKELARYAVRNFLELEERDIIIIKEKEIFIKRLGINYKRQVSESEKNTIANRYNGINEEELEDLYNEFFAKEENKSFFYYVAKLFVKTYFLEKKISNDAYEQQVFSLMQSIIAEQMNNGYNHDEDFCIGFSGYVFRRHFEEVFGHIANFILTEIAASNEYMMEFLKYYSLNIIVLNGKRYQVPALETENGRKWNVVSMLSIVKLYMKTKISLEKVKKEKQELDSQVQVLYIGEHSPLEYQNRLIKEQSEIEQTLSTNKKRLEQLRLNQDLSKSAQKKDIIRKEIAILRKESQALEEEKKKLSSSRIPSGIMNQYHALKKKLDSTVRHMHRYEKILEQNTPSYLSIKHALIKALISKKIFLGD
jgi:hypothetical protein